MKTKVLKLLTIPFLLIFLFISCEQEPIEGPRDTKLDAIELADILEKKLQPNTTGYAFAISHKEDYSVHREGGFARLSQDPPVRSMSIYEEYSSASISKTVTAAGLIKILSKLRAVKLDSEIYTFLPGHWTIGPGIKSITFRELLRHESGFRYLPGICNSLNGYQTLKSLIYQGIDTADKSYQYNNYNYAILRLIIPVLAGYDITDLSGTIGVPSPAEEYLQDQLAAKYYKEYIKNEVLDQVNVFNANLKYDIDYPPLCYLFPDAGVSGVYKGDLTLHSGGQGWVISTLSMSSFFRGLHYTDAILPKSKSDQMIAEKLGYDVNKVTKDGVQYYYKDGAYDWNNCSREWYDSGMGQGYRSLIIGFDNDIQIAIMANSPINLIDNSVEAFEEWYSTN